MQHFRVKLFAATTPGFDLGNAIPVFHRWIQKKALPELLIDVADYRHVPAGPGILLVGHDSHYNLDLAKSRLGLLYTRRTALNGSVEGRILQAGERVGIIRFGSRVDLDVPEGATVAVGVGDRVVAGRTVVARRAPRPA